MIQGGIHYFLHQLKKRLATFFLALNDVAMFLGIMLIGGLLSSWYMVEAGSWLTTRTEGPWVTWTNAGRNDADPYTRAHFAREGTLPLSTEVAQTYVAHTDNDGAKLRSACEYVIEGGDLPASWWSIALFDAEGQLIANTLQRHSFTSETIALRPDGSFSLAVSRQTRPGNWLPSGSASRLSVVLSVLESTTAIDGQRGRSLDLPEIQRTYCR